ncbi:MAG: alpha/beta fold hydrolase [Bdellovibrio sp.]|jgi:pimeloyl-ACP methyl ester carboxylesterase
MDANVELKFSRRGAGAPVVFAHGTPTYSGEYEQVANQIENSNQSILIDHLGFGDSPKPIDGDYSISAHRIRFRQTLRQKGIKKFHLVVHDFGGVIALPLLTESDSEVLSLTIINSWYWPLIETEPQMKSQKILLDSGIFPFLYKYFNFSPKVLLKLAWGSHSPLTKERHRHYISKFPTKDDRHGPIGFLKALFDFKNSVWLEADQLSKIKTPVQIIWGEADKLLSTRNLERWEAIFPKAKVVRFKNVGHFVGDEAPELLAKELIDFFRTFAK